MTYILAAFHGLGRHTDTLEPADYHEYLKMTFIQAIVSTIGGMTFLKLSIGFSLLRLGTPTLYTRLLWSLIGKHRQLRPLTSASNCLLDQHSSVCTPWYPGLNGASSANPSLGSGTRASSRNQSAYLWQPTKDSR